MLTWAHVTVCLEFCLLMNLFYFLNLDVVLEVNHSIVQSEAAQDIMQTFSVKDRQASTAQVCDDPCMLCELLMEHMLKG